MTGSSRNHEWSWSWSWCLLAGGLLLLASCGRTASASPGKDALHGATAMNQQQTQLSSLVTHDVSKAPPGVDAGLWQSRVPKDNELTPTRIALGRKLYFDTRLSADGTVACATCHDVTRSFTDRRPASEGIGGQVGRRNAPTTMNAALLPSQFWDARAHLLEDQAKMPILNPVEMGMASEEATVNAIAADADYQRMFQDAYGRPINYEDIGRAIASFERTLIFLDSPFDRFLAGNSSAISPAAKRGWLLYNGRGRCTACHPFNASNPLGTDGRFHNVGVSARHQDFEALATKALAELARDPSLQNFDKLAVSTDLSELGRFLISKSYSDIGGFRTPQIRNVGITGPYMHDGSMQTLWDVMDHYNKGGEANSYLDGGIEPLALGESEIDDIVAFLFSLTDVRFTAANTAELKKQQAQAQKSRPFRDDALAKRQDIPFNPRKK